MASHNLLPAAIVNCCVLLLMSCAAYGRLASFTYIGCFADGGPVRDLMALKGIGIIGSYAVTEYQGSYVVIQGSMTIEMCSRICSTGGWPYFGLQNSNGCYCGLSYGAHGNASETACSSNCVGNSAQKCGDLNRNSVFALNYKYTDLFVSSSRVPLTVTGSYTLQSYWNATVWHWHLAGCLIQCGSTCQGVIFSEQLGACYLLRYALVPADLVSVAGDFYVRL